MTGPRIVVLADGAELARRGADHVCASLERAVRERGRAHLALTGGTTAGILYRALASAPHRDCIDWQAVELWWGDDRFVPFDHRDSNVLLVEETLLGIGRPDPGRNPEGIVIPLANVHPFPIPDAEANGEGPDGCAVRYERELQARVPLDGRGVPVFDLVLLGVGPDGHILSCFPGSPLVDAPAPPVCAGVPAPTAVTPRVRRVTCSPRIVEAAREVLVLVTGSGKAGILREVLTGPRNASRLPAVIAAREGATWLLDAAAAAGLPAGVAAES